jgi:hypothetical protein
MRPMSMDGNYQTKDATYDSINKKLILGIVLVAIVVAVIWFYFS